MSYWFSCKVDYGDPGDHSIEREDGSQVTVYDPVTDDYFTLLMSGEAAQNLANEMNCGAAMSVKLGRYLN